MLAGVPPAVILGPRAEDLRSTLTGCRMDARVRPEHDGGGGTCLGKERESSTLRTMAEAVLPFMFRVHGPGMA